MKPSVSVVIPYRKRPAQGINHINDALAHVVADAKYVKEIFVVNNDTKPFKLTISDNRIKVVNIYSKVWNSAWARNIGLKAATGKYVANVDADIIVPPEYFKMCIASVGDAKSCGTAKVKWAKEINWKQVLSSNWKYKDKILNVGTRDNAKGLLFVQRQYFDQIRGYNELLCGWGGADCEILNRLDKIGVIHKFIEHRYAPIHLPHGKWSGTWAKAPRKKGDYNKTEIWGDPNSTWWIA